MSVSCDNLRFSPVDFEAIVSCGLVVSCYFLVYFSYYIFYECGVICVPLITTSKSLYPVQLGDLRDLSEGVIAGPIMGSSLEKEIMTREHGPGSASWQSDFAHHLWSILTYILYDFVPALFLPF